MWFATGFNTFQNHPLPIKVYSQHRFLKKTLEKAEEKTNGERICAIPIKN